MSYKNRRKVAAVLVGIVVIVLLIATAPRTEARCTWRNETGVVTLLSYYPDGGSYVVVTTASGRLAFFRFRTVPLDLGQRVRVAGCLDRDPARYAPGTWVW